jgi:hypothetical protein
MSQEQGTIVQEPPGNEAAKGAQPAERPVPRCSSPPPAAQPLRDQADPATRLHELARELMRTRNRRLLLEYLRLRQTVR